MTNKDLNLVLPERGTITFSTLQREEFIVLNSNGDIYVKGRLVETDKEVVAAFREYLTLVGEAPDIRRRARRWKAVAKKLYNQVTGKCPACKGKGVVWGP